MPTSTSSGGWRVQRYTPASGRDAQAVRSDGEPVRRLAKDYGVHDRETAEAIAMRAIEKHWGDLVVVIPVPG